MAHLPPADPPYDPSLPVRLIDVARAAGVGTMTASRALNGKGYVAAATREKILAAARRLGYRPNPLVQTLMAAVRKGRVASVANLAWITPHSPNNPPDADTSETERGARERAEALGYHLDSIHVEPGNHNAAGLSRIFEARGIRGGVLAPVLDVSRELDLPWDDFAFAEIGRSLSSPRLHHTLPNHIHNMSRLLDELASRGYRSIGMLHQRWIDKHVDYLSQMAFEHHCLERGLDPRRLCACYDGWKFGDYRRWAEANELDAVIGDLPYPYLYLRDEGLSIPGDIGYVTASWKRELPDVSGIHVPHRFLGAAATDLVTAQMHRNERGIPSMPKALLLEGKWIEGATLPDRRGGPGVFTTKCTKAGKLEER